MKREGSKYMNLNADGGARESGGHRQGAPLSSRAAARTRMTDMTGDPQAGVAVVTGGSRGVGRGRGIFR